MVSIFTKEFYSKKRICVYAVTFALSIVIYSLLMSERLVNAYDGLWNGCLFAAGAWEVSCGRFVWPILDLLRAGLCQDPYMSLISLLIISFALIVLDEVLRIKSVWQSILTNLMFISNIVVCTYLSYRFMSTTFAFSFLFSILSVSMLLSLKRPWNIIASGTSIMLSMGLYQANIGCTCLLILALIILNILQNKDAKDIGRFVLDSLLSGIVGGVLYIVFSNIFLKIFNTEMSSYRGGSSYSVIGMIVNFPNSVLRAYDQFIQYFFNNQYKITIYSIYHSFQFISAIVLLILLLCIILWICKYKLRGLIASLILLIFPMASSAILFVVTDGGNSVQMTAPQALVLPILFTFALFTFSLMREGTTNGQVIWRIAFIATVLIACGYAYTETLQVCYDQSEMQEGARVTTWMYNSTVEDLKKENLLSVENDYLYYGRPSDNKYFLTTNLYKHANDYAKVGNLMLSEDCAFYSWTGIQENFGGVQLQIASFGRYDQIRNNPDVMDIINEMPTFPEPGYIKKIDNTVIVKIADHE